jgi:dephospho-CoA kinase
MKTWVVTGGAATGKSTFCQQLLELEPGAKHFSSDDCVHRLLAGPEVARRVAASFGQAVLDDSGAVDRARLRASALVSDEARRGLEDIIHPLVYECLKKDHKDALGNGVQLFIAEVPLFYEVGHAFPADLVILVAAGEAFQRQRMISARGLDAATAQRFLSAQLPLERKIEMAPVIVWNEGSTEALKAQAKLLLQQLQHS